MIVAGLMDDGSEVEAWLRRDGEFDGRREERFCEAVAT